MGAAVTLVALEAEMAVRRAVVGAAAPAVLRWEDSDEQMRSVAIAGLRGEPGASPDMAAWASSLQASGIDPLAIADVLAGHRPVIEDWDRIKVPVVVLAGADDVMAASPTEVASRLPM